MKNKGIIAINKPQGWTSFDVVNKLKYRLKPHKVGHLGTLDPMATGVLLVTVGKATKLFDLMQEKKKTYVASFKFGYETNTLDATGEIQNRSEKLPTKDEILSVLPNFVGRISQIPPKYSAKSINGKRAYDLARNNIEFELKPKMVDIYEINFISYIDNVLKLEIVCGSGTYIRSIGRDIASKLNSLATMTELVRTKIDNFTIDSCHDIEELDLENIIIPIKNVLSLPNLMLDERNAFKLLNGQVVEIEKPDGLYSLQDNLDVIALIEIRNFRARMSVFLG